MTYDAHRSARESGVPDRNLLGPWRPWILVLVLGAVGGAAFVTWREMGRDRTSAGLDPAFVYDVEDYKLIPPEKIGYVEVAQIETGFASATAIASGPDDEIIVAGEGFVRVFEPTGEILHSSMVDATPWALAVSGDGTMFVGYQNFIEHGSLGGPYTHLLEVPGPNARITSIAVSPDTVYVADYGARVVWRFGRDGAARGRIGALDPARNVPGFVVPSPYFDVLLARDGLLRIVDPGRRRVTAFTPEGGFELAWGEASFELEGFSGCCNPSHFAQLPDGRFVTSEKGLVRVKIHAEDGRFLTAVVGAAGLDTAAGPCDVAADSRGRVLVLDPKRGLVRIFEPKEGRPR